MAKTREIRKRIKAVGNIRRITNTMQMIATARFKSSLDRAIATKPYTQKVRELVGELASAGGEIDHYLFRKPDPSPQRDYLLVLTSDRGLCGAYNSNVLRAAMGHIRGRGSGGNPTTLQGRGDPVGDQGAEPAAADLHLEVVGKKGIAFFRYAGVSVAKHHTQFGEKPAYGEVEQLAERLMSEFHDGAYDRVWIAYMRFLSAGRQTPVVEQLLPLIPPTAEEADAAQDESSSPAARASSANVEYEFRPDAESLLADLLPVTVKTGLYQAFNDAVVSEHVARMTAMKAATDNAAKLGRLYRRNYNRARQAQITTELTEIIGGAAGLS